MWSPHVIKKRNTENVTSIYASYNTYVFPKASHHKLQEHKGSFTQRIQPAHFVIFIDKKYNTKMEALINISMQIITARIIMGE
uniref:Uncharacterized protein n=1 Tax=Octopus bimaculoides TaxID=37653 RepID=A0A0L8FFP0_OCTBM